MMQRVMGLVGLLLAVSASSAVGQLRGFVNATAGVALPIGDDIPDNGGGAGFAIQGEAGVWISRIGLAAEVAQHTTANDRKVKVFGAVLRIPSWTQGPVRPYLATGLGAYRYSVSGVGSRTSVGGSVGPGALFRLRGTPAAVMLEARFHATFDRQAGLNTQQFFALLAGAELSL